MDSIGYGLRWRFRYNALTSLSCGVFMQLKWPSENAIDPALPHHTWFHSHGNCCLDFHGDPSVSELRVFSDGNHHMALEETLESFRAHHRLASVFYCTTPPKVYLDWMRSGSIAIGNLRLSVLPDLVIGPDDILSQLAAQHTVGRTAVFARSRGNSFLVRRHNPKQIQEVGDLLRDDVRLFLSNPVTESASHQVYRQTLEGLAAQAGLEASDIHNLLQSRQGVLFGEKIHHREAPQAIADGQADVALVYDHLALRYQRIFPDLFDRIPLPEGVHNITTRYAVGLVNESLSVARAAFQYLVGSATAAIYRHHGLEAAS